MTSSRKPPNIAELRTTLRTLEALAADPVLVATLDARHRTTLLDAARLLAGRPPRPTPPAPSTTTTTLPSRPTRACYVCFTTTFVDADALCPACRATEQATAAALQTAQQQHLLDGHVVVVTGGRVNIGYATALAALRLGARVLVTTRFVDDAVVRYRAEADADAWWDRLRIDALDLRDLPAIEALVARWADDIDGVDAVIHNAAQTLPLSTSTTTALSSSASSSSLLPAAEQVLSSLSPALIDEHDGPYGQAPGESWRAGIADVSTRELLEVLLVNAAAPFVFTRALLPLLRASPRTPRIVVNVTSNEGRFSFARHAVDDDGGFDERDSGVASERGAKSHRHPHLNMAKAALNMLTRTSASELSPEGVVMVAVDPGWVSGPLPTAGFASGRFPLDVDEAARRVLQPVVAAARGHPPRAGVLYKNYRPSPW